MGSFPYITAIFHFRPDRALVNVDYTMGSQVITDAVQGTHFFLSASLAMDRTYAPLDVGGQISRLLFFVICEFI